MLSDKPLKQNRTANVANKHKFTHLLLWFIEHSIIIVKTGQSLTIKEVSDKIEEASGKSKEGPQASCVGVGVPLRGTLIVFVGVNV